MNDASNDPKVDTARVSLFQGIRQLRQNHRRARVSGESGVKRYVKDRRAGGKMFRTESQGHVWGKGETRNQVVGFSAVGTTSLWLCIEIIPKPRRGGIFRPDGA